MSADSVEVIVGANVFTPTAATVDSDPGSADYTTLELSWIEGGAERRLYMYFASDGSSWWPDQIRTSDAAGEWIDSPEGERWFISPLGAAWTGNLDLPNLRIRNMSIEAFLRPAACDNPTIPAAVVSAYPTIVGVASPGLGFGGRIDLIDTATCTPVDPSPYTFKVAVDDPSIAEVISSGPTTTTTAPDGQSGRVPSVPQQLGRFDLAFRSPGETTVRVTVTDGEGKVIGTTAIPVTVRAATESSPADPTSTVAPQGASADLLSQIEHRVSLAQPSLAALGFPDNDFAVAPDGVTTISASDPTRPSERTITIRMTPGTPVAPEDHSRTPVTVTAQTSSLIRVDNHSNNGWSFSVEFTDAGGGALPSVAQLQDLIYIVHIDFRSEPVTSRSRPHASSSRLVPGTGPELVHTFA
jgi:hypothetical protein